MRAHLRLTCCCCYWLTCLFIFLISICYGNHISSDKDKTLVDNGGNPRRDELSTSYRVQRMLINLGNDNFHKDQIDFDISYGGDEEDEEDYFEPNTTEKGRFLGSPCDKTCNPDLQHVICDSATSLCDCEKSYPVRLGPTKGCAKPKRLGEQCFYRATCTFTDQHATCMQILHNAVCDCDEGYHKVAITRSNKKSFCVEDLVTISTDLPTLFGVASGIAVLGGLICFVLKLSNPTRPTNRYVDAHHGPTMLFMSDTGIPMTIAGRSSSRTSQRSDPGPLSCSTFGRRTSSGNSGRGPLVPASRAGSRRPSLASMHSSISSARSYSAKRLEKERNEKEQRLALHELRNLKHREQELQTDLQGVPIPSPRTPHDDLLPSVDEGKETHHNEIATTSKNDMSYASTSTAMTHSERTKTELLSCSTIKGMSSDTETAFNTPIAHTSNRKNNNETAGNCSNVVDIFES
ncbi:hypothetical protein HCN44_006676 [Aphidius gifuensis]|uniref:Uncharacterized protein n=1 Tax=Aphidius gifuensis TaxID=684658 RepID=A0A835CTY7_APHGI|nr:uncharacterized protein LOC122850008 isoform X2 [Aphidius gifuensis]KAF7995569.1 hypothetical protein HCN44_006676 [Aphidius gifuensis]